MGVGTVSYIVGTGGVDVPAVLGVEARVPSLFSGVFWWLSRSTRVADVFRFPCQISLFPPVLRHMFTIAHPHKLLLAMRIMRDSSDHVLCT